MPDASDSGTPKPLSDRMIEDSRQRPGIPRPSTPSDSARLDVFDEERFQESFGADAVELMQAEEAVRAAILGDLNRDRSGLQTKRAMITQAVTAPMQAATSELVGAMLEAREGIVRPMAVSQGELLELMANGFPSVAADLGLPSAIPPRVEPPQPPIQPPRPGGLPPPPTDLIGPPSRGGGQILPPSNIPPAEIYGGPDRIFTSSEAEALAEELAAAVEVQFGETFPVAVPEDELAVIGPLPPVPPGNEIPFPTPAGCTNVYAWAKQFVKVGCVQSVVSPGDLQSKLQVCGLEGGRVVPFYGTGPTGPWVIYVCAPPGSQFQVPQLPFCGGQYVIYLTGECSNESQPPPLPIPIPGPEPEPPPAEEPCIKICGLEPKECPECKCEDCICDRDEYCEAVNEDAEVWFNKAECRIQIFTKGCDGPLRTELDDWILLGRGADKERLLALLQECEEEEEEEEEEGGGKVKRKNPVANAHQLCRFIVPALGLTDFDIAGNLPNVLSYIAEQLTLLLPGGGAYAPIVGAVVGRVADAFADAIDARVKQLAADWVSTVGCNAGIIPLIYAKGSIGIANGLLGGALDTLLIPIIQQVNYACPTGVPTAAEAAAAVLADTIEMEVYRCWVRANNQDEVKYNKVVEAARSRPDIAALLRLHAREKISDKEPSEGLRGNGVIKDEDANRLKTDAEYIPSPQDVIRFMMRDVDDERVVNRFGLSDQFGDKYQGLTRKLGEANRIDDDTMLRYWRAHWQIPSPQALAEMYQRLRPGLSESGVEVTRQDVEDALIQQDIAPFWIEKYMALIERRPTRVDTRRMLERGIVNTDEAVQIWSTLGYSTENARRLVRLAEQVADTRALKHPAVKRFAAGQLNSFEVVRIMQSEGFTEEQVNKAMERGRLESGAKRRQTCLRAIRKRYLLGEFHGDELLCTVTAQGVELAEAENIIAGWHCERSSIGKHVPAQTLSAWYQDGVITKSDLMIRLVNLGFTSDDAILFIRHADIKIQRTLTAQEMARLRAEQKRIKEREAAGQRAEAELEKAERERVSNLRRQQTSAKQRQKRLLAISRRMQAKQGISLAESKGAVNAVFSAIMNSGVVTSNELLGIMEEASAAEEVDSFTTLELEAMRLVNIRIFPLDQPPEDA